MLSRRRLSYVAPGAGVVGVGVGIGAIPGFVGGDGGGGEGGELEEGCRG